MNRNIKITIIGAGAIGCTVAARFILAGYQHVSLIARGENLAHIRAHGIQLNDLTGQYNLQPFQVTDSSESLGVQDFIFIATKMASLESILPLLKPLMSIQSIVVPLMNGIPFWYFYNGDDDRNCQTIKSVDPDGILIKNFPIQNLIGATVFITAELKRHGQVNSSNPYLLIVGEPDNSQSTRIEQLKTLFDPTGIELRLSTNIRDQIWTKVIANLSSNPLSVITGATLKDIYSDATLKPISMRMAQEIRQVAACYGARIEIDPETFLKLGAAMGEVMTSMWHDFENNRALEMESIAYAVLELAEKYQCKMPLTEHICHLTQYLSKRRMQRHS